MKKILLLIMVLSLFLSACLPAILQPEVTSPAPISDADLQATAAILSQQTLQSLPSPTLLPSDTPVVNTATITATQGTPTETQNPILLTLTATLGTGTAAVSGTVPTNTAGTPGTASITVTSSATPNSAIGASSTTTPHPQHYGTMPPYLPFGKITLVNKSKAEVYISLQCTTKDGYYTVIEYPISKKNGSTVEAKAPAGKYVYVAWVGGNKIIGNFALGKNQDLTVRIYKDHLEIH